MPPTGRGPRLVLVPVADAATAAQLNETRRALEAAGDPCHDCPCCARWELALELYAAAARAHVTRQGMPTCPAGCLVCAMAFQ